MKERKFFSSTIDSKGKINFAEKVLWVASECFDWFRGKINSMFGNLSTIISKAKISSRKKLLRVAFGCKNWFWADPKMLWGFHV